MLDLRQSAKVFDIQVKKQSLVETQPILLDKRRMNNKTATVKCFDFDSLHYLSSWLPFFAASVSIDFRHIAVNDLHAKSGKTSARSTHHAMQRILVKMLQ